MQTMYSPIFMILDLIIPFYNPQPGWADKLLYRVNTLANSYFGGDKRKINLIIVNDGSRRPFEEKDLELLSGNIPNFKAIGYTENKGKGYALRTGVQEALTPYCIYTDNDFPFGLEIIYQMYEALKNGTDIVTGHRANGNYFHHLPLKRRLASKGLSFFNKYILRLPVSDTQAGIKGFNEYGKILFLNTRTDRFLFDLEFILLSRNVKGMVIRELDVNVVEDIRMTDFSKEVMRQELRNLVNIILKRKYRKQTKQELLKSATPHNTTE